MPPPEQPSFSPAQKWRIAFQVALLSLTVFCVVVMVNYLGRDYSRRFFLSSQTRAELAPQTERYLKTLTNRIKVVLYYDRKEPLYSTVADLLYEYHRANPRILVQTVDYLRDPGAAQKVKADYKLGSQAEKNLVIFDCEGRVKMVDGKALADYATEAIPGEKERTFLSRAVNFKGELVFTSLILAVTNPKPLKACFLTGDGEHQIDSADDVQGYLKFATLLRQNYIQVDTLSLLGTNTVPADCHLLIIAGPTLSIPEPVLEKVDQYLTQGGRLLVLFRYESARREIGLEKILAKWGVAVGANVVKDPENTVTGSDVVVSRFGGHPVVNPLANESGLHLILPRTVGRLKNSVQAADAPRVTELAFTGPKSFLAGEETNQQSYPLMVAVEKGAVKGVITERGTMRMAVLGDSIFLANRPIGSAGNLDFAGYLVNWLLDRSQLLQGVGPRPVTQYRVVMTRRQLQTTQLLLLGGMPGVILLLGGLVWLRRRR